MIVAESARPSERLQALIKLWKSDKVCDRSYYINLLEPLVAGVAAAETRAQAAEKIIKEYCDVCEEGADKTGRPPCNQVGCWFYDVRAALRGDASPARDGTSNSAPEAA